MRIRRKKCPVCKTPMHRFVNPERWICPKESTHPGILAKQRQREGQERGRETARRRGPTQKQREQGKKAGKAFGGKNKKPRAGTRKTNPVTGFVKKQRMREWNLRNPQPRDPKTGKFVKKKKNGNK